MLKTLANMGSLKIADTQPFKVSKNSLAPLKLDIREVISYPSKRDKISQLLINEITNNFGKDYDVFAGLSPVGIPFTYLIANKLKMPMIYVRDKEINSIDGRYSVEGIIKENDKIILLINEMRSGNRIIDAIKILHKRGAKVIGCVSLIDYNLCDKSKFDELGVKCSSLFNLNDVLNLGLVTEEQKQSITEWKNNYDAWVVHQKNKLEDKIKEIKKNVIEIFINLGLVEFHLSNPLKFKHIYSPVIIDTKKLLSYPAERDFVFNSMLELLKEKINFDKIDLIVGEASSGIAPATWIAENLRKPMIYVHDDSDTFSDIIEAKIKNNDHVLLVDDVIGTGGGTLNAIQRIEQLGGVVRNFASIVDYGLMHAKQLLGYENVMINSVITLEELLEAAEEQSLITEEEKQVVLDWMQDPFTWSQKLSNQNLNEFMN